MISPSARIGSGCDIAPTAVIHTNVELGDGSTVGDFCIIGAPARGARAGQTLVIGAGSTIRSHSVLYEGSTFGPGLNTGHHALLREGVRAGRALQVGSYCDLEGEADIGDWVRMHSSVHIGRGTSIGDLCWIFPYVVTTNDPAPPSGLMKGASIGHGAVVCTSSVVLPGAKIGAGAFIAAMTRAAGTIPAGAVFSGNPGSVVGSLRLIRDRQDRYHGVSTVAAGTTWYGHYSDAYPADAQARIRELQAEVEAACDRLDAERRG